MILSIGLIDSMSKVSAPSLKKDAEKDSPAVLNTENNELLGVPKSYISFKAKDSSKINFTDDAQRLFDRAKEIAKNFGHSEISAAHIIQASIEETDENLSQLDEELLSTGVVDSVSTLSKLINNYTKNNMLQTAAARDYMNDLINDLREDNAAYMDTIPVEAKVENVKLSASMEEELKAVEEKTHAVDSYMLLGTAINEISKKGGTYTQQFLQGALSYGLYKNIEDIKPNYMKIYDNRAIEVWNKLALGSNLNVTYDDAKEAERITASIVNTLNAEKHGNFNTENTHIFAMSNDIKDTELMDEVMNQKTLNPEMQKIFLVDLDRLLVNSMQANGEISYTNGLSQAIASTDDKLKIVFFQSSDVYYKLVKDPTLKSLFDNFLSYSIPPVQSYEAQSLLNKKMLKDVPLPFTSDAKDRVIYHAGRMKGIFPDKAVDLMKRVSGYYANSKKKITAKEVDEFAQIANELFEKSAKQPEVIYDTGKTLASMYGKETTKKDIEAIIRQIKTGKIGTKGLLIYSKDPEAGSGRKYTAETIAGEAKVPFLSISSSDFAVSERDNEGVSIETPKNAMSRIFTEAKKAARQNQYKTAIMFINNFEEFAFSGPYLPGYRQAMAQLTDEMQKAVSEDVSILVIGSTEKDYADLIPEVVRGFNQHIAVDSPAFNKASRKEILENRIKESKLPLAYRKLEDKEHMMDKLVKLTEHMSFVEIKSLIEKAEQIMYERNKSKASIGEFIEAYLQMLTGRTSRPEMPMYNKIVTTSHECGHATNLEVMNDIMQRKGKPWHNSENVNFITLDPRGNFLGAVFENKTDNTDYPFEAMFTGLVCTYGGYSCEKMFFDMDGSVGISQDLAQASAAAKRGIEYCGFGYNTGKISNAANIKSGKYQELVFTDMNVILKNAQMASDLITECYKKFNDWFTQKYSKLIGTDDCMVDGDDFRKSLSAWRKSLPEAQKEEISIMEDIIMDIIDSSKKGKIYGKIKQVVK